MQWNWIPRVPKYIKFASTRVKCAKRGDFNGKGKRIAGKRRNMQWERETRRKTKDRFMWQEKFAREAWVRKQRTQEGI